MTLKDKKRVYDIERLIRKCGYEGSKGSKYTDSNVVYWLDKHPVHDITPGY